MKKISNAFTMAEILISLTIIGIIAAIVLPALQGNINERAWNAQRQAFYSRLSQSLALLPTIMGYGVFNAETDTAAATFVVNGLSKVYELKNTCTLETATNAQTRREEMAGCGIPSTVVGMSGQRVNFPTTSKELASYLANDTIAAAFETKNGESVAVFYDPYCRSLDEITNSEAAQVEVDTEDYFCANFVYDLNGRKGPNTYGKDIGTMTAFVENSEVNLVAPMPVWKNFGPELAQDGSGWQLPSDHTCHEKDPSYRLANLPEIISMAYNRAFLDFPATGRFWSNSLYNKIAVNGQTGAEQIYYPFVLIGNSGAIIQYWNSPEAGQFARCIKKY